MLCLCAPVQDLCVGTRAGRAPIGGFFVYVEILVYVYHSSRWPTGTGVEAGLETGRLVPRLLWTVMILNRACPALCVIVGSREPQA